MALLDTLHTERGSATAALLLILAALTSLSLLGAGVYYSQPEERQSTITFDPPPVGERQPGFDDSASATPAFLSPQPEPEPLPPASTETTPALPTTTPTATPALDPRYALTQHTHPTPPPTTLQEAYHTSLAPKAHHSESGISLLAGTTLYVDLTPENTRFIVRASNQETLRVDNHRHVIVHQDAVFHLQGQLKDQHNNTGQPGQVFGLPGTATTARWADSTAFTAGGLTCHNCLNEQHIQDIFVKKAGDTITGTLNIIGDAIITGSLTAQGGQTIAAANTPGSVLFINSSGAISEDNDNLFWDTENSRLGINTTTPDHALHILGDIRVSGEAIFSIIRNINASAGTIAFHGQDGTVKETPDLVYDENSQRLSVPFLATRRDAWMELAQLPGPAERGTPRMAYTGDDYIYSGGDNGTSEWWRYSISADEWEQLADAPAAFANDSATVYTGGDHIFVSRGWQQNAFWRYSISSDSWDVMESFSASFDIGHSMVYTGGDFIYAVRGWNTQLWRYSISADEWEQLAASPNSMRQGSYTVYTGGDYIYAYRGANSSTFYRYSISQNAWSTMAGAPAAIDRGAALVYAGGNYIYGSQPQSASTGATGWWRYSISDDQWMSAPADLPMTTQNGGNVVLGDAGYIYARAGAGGQGFWRYTPGTSTGFSTLANAGAMVRGNIATDGRDIGIMGGNVGIGTAAPEERLHVAGNVKIGTFDADAGTSVCFNASNVLVDCSASSKEYKAAIASSTLGLKEVLQLNPVTFRWKHSNQQDIGLIAQDVAKVDPLLITRKDGKVHGVRYDRLSTVLISAIQEQQQQITALQDIIGTRPEQTLLIQDLSDRVTTLERQMAKLLEAASGGRPITESGRVVVSGGEDWASVTFERPFGSVPAVQLTPETYTSGYRVVERRKDGFVVELEEKREEDVVFVWSVIADN